MTEEQRIEIVRQLNTISGTLQSLAQVLGAVANRLMIVDIERVNRRPSIAPGGDGEAD